MQHNGEYILSPVSFKKTMTFDLAVYILVPV